LELIVSLFMGMALAVGKGVILDHKKPMKWPFLSLLGGSLIVWLPTRDILFTLEGAVLGILGWAIYCMVWNKWGEVFCPCQPCADRRRLGRLSQALHGINSLHLIYPSFRAAMMMAVISRQIKTEEEFLGLKVRN